MYTTAVIQLCNRNNSYKDDVQFPINSSLCYHSLLLNLVIYNSYKH